jgi:hypothetical protein
MIDVQTNTTTLHVIAHALDYFIQNVDINDPLEREICARAIQLQTRIETILKEERNKRDKRSINLNSKTSC